MITGKTYYDNYYINNKERMAEQQKKYREDNRERLRENQRRSYAKKRLEFKTRRVEEKEYREQCPRLFRIYIRELIEEYERR